MNPSQEAPDFTLVRNGICLHAQECVYYTTVPNVDFGRLYLPFFSGSRAMVEVA